MDTSKTPLRLSLSPPIEFEGKIYNELLLDFPGLGAKDIAQAERTLLRLYKAEKRKTAAPDRHLFCCILAAQAANVPLGVITALPRRYYTAIRAAHLKAYGDRGADERIDRSQKGGIDGWNKKRIQRDLFDRSEASGFVPWRHGASAGASESAQSHRRQRG